MMITARQAQRLLMTAVTFVTKRFQKVLTIAALLKPQIFSQPLSFITSPLKAGAV
jgi:hypothetical protein